MSNLFRRYCDRRLNFLFYRNPFCEQYLTRAVVVALVIAAVVWYKAGSASAVVEPPETTAPPAPTATPEPTPTATETPMPTEEPTEPPSNTDHKLTSEEVANMTAEEQRQYIQDTMRDTGAVGSLEEMGGEHITDEEFKEFMDETWNVDNPYIKDIIDSGVLNN